MGLVGLRWWAGSASRLAGVVAVVCVDSWLVAEARDVQVMCTHALSWAYAMCQLPVLMSRVSDLNLFLSLRPQRHA